MIALHIRQLWPELPHMAPRGRPGSARGLIVHHIVLKPRIGSGRLGGDAGFGEGFDFFEGFAEGLGVGGGIGLFDQCTNHVPILISMLLNICYRPICITQQLQ